MSTAWWHCTVVGDMRAAVETCETGKAKNNNLMNIVSSWPRVVREGISSVCGGKFQIRREQQLSKFAFTHNNHV